MGLRPSGFQQPMADKMLFVLAQLHCMHCILELIELELAQG